MNTSVSVRIRIQTYIHVESMINIKPLPEEGLTLDNSIDVFHDWLGFCNDNGLGNPEFLVPAI